MLLWRWRIATLQVCKKVWQIFDFDNVWCDAWRDMLRWLLMHGETWKSCGHVGRRRISFVYVCEREIWFGALVLFNQMAASSKLLLMTASYCPTPPNALHPYSGSNWYIHIGSQDICGNGLVESCFVSPRHLGCLDVCPCFNAKDTVHKEDMHGVFCCFLTGMAQRHHIDMPNP